MDENPILVYMSREGVGCLGDCNSIETHLEFGTPTWRR